MKKINIQFPDKSKKSFEKGISGYEIAKSIGDRLAQAALAIEVDGELKDLYSKIKKDAKIRIITFNDKEGKDIFRHSASHIMANAVLRLFPKAKITIGPAIEDGFYYDFDIEKPFTEKDLERIEKLMKEIITEKQEYIRLKPKDKKEAKKILKKHHKNNEYKLELINDLKDDDATFYQHGDFVDLCKGPHVPHTGKIKAVKLTKIAGAYWRGDAKNKQLNRIYGVAFPDKKELNKHLEMLREAEKRDHRKIGRELDIFEIDEDIGPGLVLWLPKGNIIKEELEKWAKETEKKWGYSAVTTPIITKEGLFHTSEHLPHYKESMFSPMDIDGENYYIKPMNCPFHHKIFSARTRSYRDLPLRIAEYGWCHRYEQSGAITGMMRVRGMQMNDAHIYCTKDQAVKEFIDVIRLHEYYYKKLGITEYSMELALRDPNSDKYHGNEKMWKEAEKLMMTAMKKSGVKYTVVEGGAAFYGPKIDFQIKSVIGREFTASTNQIDLFMAGKFKLKYAGEDGKEHIPVVIHRAPLGTHERFIGFLIEHFDGKFPLWLNPVQVKIMTVSQKLGKHAEKLKEQFSGIRVEIDNRAESIPRKVREAQLQKIPIMLTLGDKEVKNNTVALRTLDNQVKFGVKPEDLLKKIRKNIKDKELKFRF